MRRPLWTCWLPALLVLGIQSAANGTDSAEPVVGPAKGTLVIAGGGGHSEAILKRFIELAGGAQAPIVIIPTAAEEEPADLDHCPSVEALRSAGAACLSFLHTRDRAKANAEDFIQPLRLARAVWLSGGRQWRLTEAYLGTRTQAELEALLARGGVIGGSSSGASVQASLMLRGDPTDNSIMISPHHSLGFGFLKNCAIDQHVLIRHRENDLIQILRDHPEVLGIGLDEDTAIVVHGDECEVLGLSKALFYNAQSWPPSDGKWWLALGPGQRFDLKTRRVLK
jgi:cyanophycinase